MPCAICSVPLARKAAYYTDAGGARRYTCPRCRPLLDLASRSERLRWVAALQRASGPPGQLRCQLSGLRLADAPDHPLAPQLARDGDELVVLAHRVAQMLAGVPPQRFRAEVRALAEILASGRPSRYLADAYREHFAPRQ